MRERSRQLIFGNNPPNIDNESSNSQDYFKLKTIYVTNEAIITVKKHDREGKAIFAKKKVNIENM